MMMKIIKELIEKLSSGNHYCDQRIITESNEEWLSYFNNHKELAEAWCKFNTLLIDETFKILDRAANDRQHIEDIRNLSDEDAGKKKEDYILSIWEIYNVMYAVENSSICKHYSEKFNLILIKFSIDNNLPYEDKLK